MFRRTFTLIVLLYAITLSAQNEVKGVIIDKSTDFPIIGATVLIKDTSIGTTTDFDGNFILPNVPDGATLVFSYLGFVSLELVVNNNEISIYLEPSISELDEVVLVGYGTQAKKEVTGAVSVLGSKDIEKLNPVRVEQAMQGQVAGVTVTSASGSPGSGSNIRIRGISTNGDSRPLIMVDGNIIEDLSVINPNDIKSINILKDATAGIYGVQGANGVILIETKTGRKNTPIRVNIDSYYGFQNTSKKVDLIDNAYDYATLINNAAVNGGSRIKYNTVENRRLVFGLKDPVNPIETFTDWQDAVFETAAIHNTNVGFSGGTWRVFRTYLWNGAKYDRFFESGTARL